MSLDSKTTLVLQMSGKTVSLRISQKTCHLPVVICVCGITDTQITENMKNFTITKRDGSKAVFSLDKIMSAIAKAFESVNQPADLGTISKILCQLKMHDDITVEDIQNQVEVALMKEGH